MAQTNDVRIGPTTAEGFLADRQAFWAWFTRALQIALGVILVLLIGLAVFLL